MLMRLISYLQKLGVGLIALVLCAGLVQGVAMAQDAADEEMSFTEAESINNAQIGADKIKYQCDKYVKLCPETKPANLARSDLRLECAVCGEYLQGKALEDYKKYFYYDFNSNFEFDDVGANSEKKLVDLAIAKGGAVNTDVPEDANSKYGYYIGQRDTTGDVPNSSEFFAVDTLTAPGQVGFFKGTSGNPVLDFIVRMMGLLVYMIGLAALVVIVIGAYFLLTAAGDDEQLSKGKDVIKLGLTGMVIVLFAYMIVTFVQALIY